MPTDQEIARDDIRNTYDVSNGVIRSPGKFESEAEYVPYFWDMSGDGSAEMLDWSDGSTTYVVEVDDADRAAWNIGAAVVALHLAESDQGFVSCERLSRNSLAKLREQNEADNEESEEDEEETDESDD